MKKLVFLPLFVFLFAFLSVPSQLIKTQMAMTVRDGLGNTVEDAQVQLFEKEEDYNTEKNAVANGTTDKRGVVRFKELQAISYFVLVKKGDKNNINGGEKTGELVGSRINKVTVVIE